MIIIVLSQKRKIDKHKNVINTWMQL